MLDRTRAESLSFNDALETNDSAVKLLGEDTLRLIARELVNPVRKNATIDWTVKESVRAKLRVETAVRSRGLMSRRYFAHNVRHGVLCQAQRIYGGMAWNPFLTSPR
jgi:hypothetical protein